MQTTINRVAAMRLSDFAATNSVGLTRFAYLLCRDRALAEDLVQDSLLAMYRRFGDELDIAAPVAYARRAIANAYTSQRRRKILSQTVLTEPPDRPAPQPATEEQDAMWQALGSLPERQRAVLVLRYYLDLPDAEIADALGAREGTVRSLAARAFAALRNHPALLLPEVN